MPVTADYQQVRLPLNNFSGQVHSRLLGLTKNELRFGCHSVPCQLSRDLLKVDCRLPLISRDTHQNDLFRLL